MGILRRVCEDTPRPLTETNLNVPAWLDAFIAKLHAKQPADRFESASQVSDLLTNCLSHVQQPNLVPLPDEVASLMKRPLTRSRSWSQTTWIGTSVIATAGVMIALIGQGLFHSNEPSREQSGSPIRSTSGVPTETDWLDGQDEAARELDQRTRQLEQEPEQW